MSSQQHHKQARIKGRRRQKLLTIFACLVIAMVFWFFNALNNDYAAIIRYPVKVIYDKEKYTLNADSDKHIKISATGYGWYLLYYSLGLGVEPIEVPIDFIQNKGFVPENKLLELAKANLDNVDVNAIVSDTFKVDAQPLSKKKFFLKLDTKKISLPRGKTIANVVVNPGYIVCKGPFSQLNHLPDTIYFSIPNKYIETDFNEKVAVSYHPSTQVVQDISRVNVSFSVK